MLISIDTYDLLISDMNQTPLGAIDAEIEKNFVQKISHATKLGLVFWQDHLPLASSWVEDQWRLLHWN